MSWRKIIAAIEFIKKKEGQRPSVSLVAWPFFIIVPPFLVFVLYIVCFALLSIDKKHNSGYD